MVAPRPRFGGLPRCAGLILLVAGISAYADPGKGVVHLAVPAELTTVWQELIERNPLPAEPLSDGNDSVNHVGTIALIQTSWREPAPEQIFGEQKLIRRTYYAPTTRITHPDDQPEIVPLHSVRLPLAGLPIDGIYPFDEGYPLIEDIYLAVDAPNRSIARWFEEITEYRLQDKLVWITAVGDIMLSRGVDRDLLNTTLGERHVFSDTLDVFRDADVLLGNLECVASAIGRRAHKTYTFRCDPRALGALKQVGFDYLSVTNNHSHDFGTEAFLNMLDNFKTYGIATSGAGINRGEAVQPADIVAAGQSFRVLSLGAFPAERSGFDGRTSTVADDDNPGILWADSDALELVEKELAGRGFGIVMVHGGTEWTSHPTPEQQRLYRSLIDSGADLVVGTHPHYLQGVEAYQGGLIAYSIGNFLFPGMEDTQYGEQTAILRVGVYRNEIRYVELIPAVLHGTTVRQASDDTIAKRLRMLTRELNPTDPR